MSGYFTRIARQSGARIAGDGRLRPKTPAVKKESHLSPMDHEETVMVLPRPTSDVPVSKTAKPNTAAAVVQDQTRGEKSLERSKSAIDPATEILPAKAKRPAAPEPVVEEVKLIEREAASDSSRLPEPTSTTAEERKTETVKPIVRDESAKKIPAPPRTAETLPEKVTEKKFFEKTVEIVEGQTAEPAEVHTILLREVQEWIAAGRTAPAELTADVADFAAENMSDTSLPGERQPAVVRIAEARRAVAPPEPIQEVSTTVFSEQNFELSIGSISVVVEGPPSPAPPPVSAQPAARDTPPRRTSRLSRHYL